MCNEYLWDVDTFVVGDTYRINRMSEHNEWADELTKSFD